MSFFWKCIAPVFVVIIIFCAEVYAVDNETGLVEGKTYASYILTLEDTLDTNIIFKENYTFDLSMFNGAGYYFVANQFFAGVYFSLDSIIGKDEGDFSFILTGYCFDPVIFGVLIGIFDYKRIYVSPFYGILGLE